MKELRLFSLIRERQSVSIALNSPTNLSFLKTAAPKFSDPCSPEKLVCVDLIEKSDELETGELLLTPA